MITIEQAKSITDHINAAKAEIMQAFRESQVIYDAFHPETPGDWTIDDSYSQTRHAIALSGAFAGLETASNVHYLTLAVCAGHDGVVPDCNTDRTDLL